MKIQSPQDLIDIILPEEWLMVDILRQIVLAKLPDYCKEKISFSVPYFYGRRGICIIWPASIPRGGFKEGVLLGFWQGNKLADEDNYLTKGTNKKVYYRIYKSAEEIDVAAIEKLLDEAIAIDLSHKK